MWQLPSADQWSASNQSPGLEDLRRPWFACTFPQARRPGGRSLRSIAGIGFVFGMSHLRPVRSGADWRKGVKVSLAHRALRLRNSDPTVPEMVNALVTFADPPLFRGRCHGSVT